MCSLSARENSCAMGRAAFTLRPGFIPGFTERECVRGGAASESVDDTPRAIRIGAEQNGVTGVRISALPYASGRGKRQDNVQASPGFRGAGRGTICLKGRGIRSWTPRLSGIAALPARRRHGANRDQRHRSTSLNREPLTFAVTNEPELQMVLPGKNELRDVRARSSPAPYLAGTLGGARHSATQPIPSPGTIEIRALLDMSNVRSRP